MFPPAEDRDQGDVSLQMKTPKLSLSASVGGSAEGSGGGVDCLSVTVYEQQLSATVI